MFSQDRYSAKKLNTAARNFFFSKYKFMSTVNIKHVDDKKRGNC